MLEVIHTPTLTSILGFSFFYGENMVELTQERLKKYLTYDERSGLFFWTSAAHQPLRNKQAGCPNKQGHIRIRLERKSHYAHRLAWLYVYGCMPTMQIDHLNGVRDDNRIANLRDVSQSVNQQNQRRAHSNNKSGYLGVIWRRDRNKWESRIMLSGKSSHLGYFEDPSLAHEAYLLKKREIHEGCLI
jgi:hypothetical protein